jgi:hypothetical protein
VQGFLSNHLYSRAKCLFQLHLEAADIEQTAAGFHIDENVDVARCVCLTPGNRSENADVTGAVARSNPKYFFTLRGPKLRDVHL